VRLVEIAVILRKDGFFHYRDRKIKAVYPWEGWLARAPSLIYGTSENKLVKNGQI